MVILNDIKEYIVFFSFMPLFIFWGKTFPVNFKIGNRYFYTTITGLEIIINLGAKNSSITYYLERFRD